uniref:Uncharacterized protein n=1 Tax=Panagrolaimus sp. PS1159 TaxID=55785 RepID=A0AC35GXR5_9BILA
MKSILNIFKGKDGRDKGDKRRVQFNHRVEVCKNSTPIRPHQHQQSKQQQQQKKSSLSFRDDMFFGKTAGYDTAAKPRTRKPLESCPGNIAAVNVINNINSSPSTNSEIADDMNDENIDQQTSFSSENGIDYYARYKHYKKLSRVLSHQNNNLQLRLYQYESQPSSSAAYPDAEELQQLRIENAQLRSRFNQLTIDIERSLNYQKPPTYYHLPPPPQHHQMNHHRQNLLLYSHHQQQPLHGYPSFNPSLCPSPATASTQYPLFDIPRNFSANGQYDPSETDNTDQGEQEKNIFGNSIPKVAAVTAHSSTPNKSTDSEDIC